jgi:HK97 family phage prohead protease
MDFKSVKFKKESLNPETRIFEGYAATWDLDSGNDVIVKGAFAKTLNERGGKIKVLWQHYDPIGIPLEMREDDKGLWVKAKISATALGNEALELIKDGVIDSMSIGYSPIEDKTDFVGGIRYLREIKLYEFSVVTFPMNEEAVITGVKRLISKNINSNLITDLEALLEKYEPSETLNFKKPLLGADEAKQIARIINNLRG